MARIFDVIEWADAAPSDIVHRVPEHGAGDFRIGSQLIVRESQSAVFFRDGKALDSFGPGRHTITTANIPLLIGLIGKAFGNRSPFTAEVYFVNLRDFLDQKWGTPDPIALRDSDLGLVRVMARGSYSMQVADPQLFVNKIVGVQGIYSTSQISGYLRNIITSKTTDLLATTMKSVLDLPRMLDELSAGGRAKLADDFAVLGIALKTFYITSVGPTEQTAQAIDEAASIGAIGNMQAYTQYKAAQAMVAAAESSGEAGSLAAAGVGVGAGVGIGAAMAGAIGQATQPQARAQAASPVACSECGAQNATGSRFCASCGAQIGGGIKCPNCGTQNPAGAKFCTNCGNDIGGSVKCANCGTENAAGAKFCSDCGEKLG